ncbi:17144_t:CDS:2, partial [Dentiscutata erythropus]
GILQQYNGKLLFGLEEPQTRHLINSLRDINWQEFFNQWLTEQSTIIELKFQLKKLYPSEHEINEREFRAWKTMLRNVGCVEITLFEKDQSK